MRHAAAVSKHTPFLIILIGYLCVGSLYALYTPAWQAPDEPAHYNYVRQLAAGRFPIMEPDDYSQAYQSQVIASRFDPQYSIEPFTYEDYQPPLYYLLQTPVFWLSGGDLHALRLFSVFLGVITLTLAYGVTTRIFVERRWLALTAVAFSAFLPQHVAILASVNNDALSELLIAALLLVLVKMIRDWGTSPTESGNSSAPPLSPRADTRLALLLGLGFLTKATVYLMAPVIALVLLWRYWGYWRTLGQALGRVFVPALAMGAVWWIRNLRVYGWPDFMGIQAHGAAVVGQPQTRAWLAEFGVGYTLRAFAQTTFQSFWGQFGWMGVVMPAWVYRLLALFTAGVLMGLFLYFVQKRTLIPSGAEKPGQKSRWLLVVALTSLLLLNATLYLAYNVTYVQHQGRYLFASLIPISIGVALGLHGWLLLVRRWAVTPYLLPLGLTLGLLGLDLLALFRFIVPSLSLP